MKNVPKVHLSGSEGESGCLRIQGGLCNSRNLVLNSEDTLSNTDVNCFDSWLSSTEVLK